MKAFGKQPRQPELELEKVGKCTKSLAVSLRATANSKKGESGLGKMQQFEAYNRPKDWGRG